MNPRVKDVKSNPDHALTLVFNNGGWNVFDVKPYLDQGILKEFKNSKGVDILVKAI